MSIKLTLINYAERVFWTFVQAFVAFYLAKGTLDFDTASAAAMAGAAAALTVVLGLVTDWTVPNTLPSGVLAVVRVLRTGVASTLAVLLSAPTLDLSSAGWKVALIGAAPAVLSVIKSIAAEHVGDMTPALLPAKLDALSKQNANPVDYFGS